MYEIDYIYLDSLYNLIQGGYEIEKTFHIPFVSQLHLEKEPMNKKSLMIIIGQSFVIILLIWVVILMGSDEFVDDDLFDEEETLSFIG